MSEQLKHFLKLKLWVIGAIGLKMLAAEALVLKALASGAILLKAWLIASLASFPVFAQNFPQFYATDSNWNLVTVEKGIDTPLPPPVPGYKKFGIESAADKLKEHGVADEEPNPKEAIGKTSLSGVPMTLEEQAAYVAMLEAEKQAKIDESIANKTAIGKTSLSGVPMTAEEKAEYEKILAESQKVELAGKTE